MVKLQFPEASKALNLDVFASCQQMDNGENRTRLTGDGTANPFSYIRVELPFEEGTIGAWQNAHRHDHVTEIWIVERGIQLVAEETENGEIDIHIMFPGDTYTSKTGINHNCFVSPGAITHTVKVNNIPNDWIPAPEFDQKTKELDMESFIKEKNLIDCFKFHV